MRYSIPIQFIKLEDGFHLLVKLRVNEKTARLLIDTGASHTVFDAERIKAFLKNEKMELQDRLSTGLGTNSMQSHAVKIGTFQLGKLTIRNYKAVVIDLSHVNHAYGQLKLHPIDGVLGSDLLKKFKANIDFGKRRLVLTSK